MKLDADIGKVYCRGDFYYLEKIFKDLGSLIDEEDEIKRRAKRHGFKIVKSHWEVQSNPNYHIETIINENDTTGLNPLRFVYVVKLKYKK